MIRTSSLTNIHSLLYVSSSISSFFGYIFLISVMCPMRWFWSILRNSILYPVFRHTNTITVSQLEPIHIHANYGLILCSLDLNWIHGWDCVACWAKYVLTKCRLFCPLFPNLRVRSFQRVPNSIWVIAEWSQGLDSEIKKIKKNKNLVHKINAAFHCTQNLEKKTTLDMESHMVIQVVIPGDKLGHDPPSPTSQARTLNNPLSSRFTLFSVWVVKCALKLCGCHFHFPITLERSRGDRVLKAYSSCLSSYSCVKSAALGACKVQRLSPPSICCGYPCFSWADTSVTHCNWKSGIFTQKRWLWTCNGSQHKIICSAFYLFFLFV